MDANLTFKVPAYVLPGEYLNVRKQTEDGNVIDRIAAIDVVDSYNIQLTMTSGAYHTLNMELLVTHARNGGKDGLTTVDSDLITPFDIKADLAAFEGLIDGAVAMVGNIESGTVDVFKFMQLMTTLKAVNEGTKK